MTFCLAIKVKKGIVGIADTRITSGTQTTTAKKVFTVNKENHSYFIMTSGLRSVRDKAITYFREIVENNDDKYDKLYKAVNAFADQVKRVAREDKESLRETGLSFNLFALVGGQLQNDSEHKVYLLYPEGNWVEVSKGSPFTIIGNGGYGKPILDRVLNYDSSLSFSLKAGFLSFNATQVSANDVDYPIDVLYYEKDSYKIVETRYYREELQEIAALWQQQLSQAVQTLPEGWTSKLMDEGQVNSEIS